MWGPGPWGAPMWGFWWIFPLIGLLICLLFIVAMVRFMGGRGFMCMGSSSNDSEAVTMAEIRARRRPPTDSITP